ncbi:hypothetical protein J2T14_002097 [Paenibacillus harenae]|nr:hypothetical protein [Paenibacillus harenae]
MTFLTEAVRGQEHISLGFISYTTEPTLVYAEMDKLISEEDLSDEELEQPELVERLKREGIHPLASTFTELINRLYSSDE